MTESMTPGMPAGTCRHCTAVGTHYLTCRMLKLIPGWAERAELGWENGES